MASFDAAFCVNNVVARPTTFLDLFGNDTSPERDATIWRCVERGVKDLVVAVRSVVVDGLDIEIAEREDLLFVSRAVSRVRTDVVVRDGCCLVVVVRAGELAVRSAPLATPIDNKQDKIKNRKPFFLILY